MSGRCGPLVHPVSTPVEEFHSWPKDEVIHPCFDYAELVLAIVDYRLGRLLRNG